MGGRRILLTVGFMTLTLPLYAQNARIEPSAGQWKTWVISSGKDFRVPPPPTPSETQAELRALADLINHNDAQTAAQIAFWDAGAPSYRFPRSPAAFGTNSKAFYWQSPDRLNTWVYHYLDKWLFEDRLDRNPPRAARAYALVTAVQFDVFIASQDGKYTYWYIRPSQLDAGITPLFPVPSHPSYPSNHSSFSNARAEVVAHLFPNHADVIRAAGKEAGDSRIWAGIHYQMDNMAGANLGKAVAGVFINWAENDGSQ
jgi:PAP2 superfamily